MSNTNTDKAMAWWDSLTSDEKVAARDRQFPHTRIDDIIPSTIEYIWDKEGKPSSSKESHIIHPLGNNFKQMIIQSWATIRKENNTIPDEVLDYMKDSAINYQQLKDINQKLLGILWAINNDGDLFDIIPWELKEKIKESLQKAKSFNL